LGSKGVNLSRLKLECVKFGKIENIREKIQPPWRGQTPPQKISGNAPVSISKATKQKKTRK